MASDQIDVIMADLDRYTRGEIISLGLNINANLRSQPPIGTPIDTGWASANWVPGIGVPEYDPVVAAVRDPTAAQVAAAARRAEQGVNDVLSWRQGDGPIFSANSVPYVGKLNDGWSGQSPAGFVQSGLALAVRQTKARAQQQGDRNRRAAAYRARTGKPARPGR